MNFFTAVTDFFTDLFSTTSEESSSPESTVPGNNNPTPVDPLNQSDPAPSGN